MSLLKRSGALCHRGGSDASSDETLSGLNKHFTFDDVYEFNQSCVDAQIPCAHYVIFGGPGETEATVKKGLSNLEMLKNCVVFAFSGIRIFPNTMIQAQAIEEGVLRKGDSLLKPTYYFSPEIDAETMDNMIKTGFKGRRDRIFPPSQGLEMARIMNKYGYHGLLWDRLNRGSTEKYNPWTCLYEFLNKTCHLKKPTKKILLVHPLWLQDGKGGT